MSSPNISSVGPSHIIPEPVAGFVKPMESHGISVASQGHALVIPQAIETVIAVPFNYEAVTEQALNAGEAILEEVNFLKILDDIETSKTKEEGLAKLNEVIERFAQAGGVANETTQQSYVLVTTIMQLISSDLVTIAPPSPTQGPSYVSGLDGSMAILQLISTLPPHAKSLVLLFQKRNQLKTNEKKLQKLKSEYEAFKKTGDSSEVIVAKKQAIIQLKKEIKNQSKELGELGKGLAVGGLLSLPQLLAITQQVVEWIGKFPQMTQLASALAIPAAVAGAIGAGIAMRSAVQAEALHAKTVMDLEPTTVTLPEIRPSPKAEKFIGDEAWASTRSIVQATIDKRKDVFEVRRHAAEVWLMEVIGNIEGNVNRSPQEKFNALVTELDKKKISLNLNDFQNEDNKIEAFKKRLLMDKKFYTDVVEQLAERKDALSQTAKNNLKARLVQNERVNKGFFSFKTVLSKVAFGIAIISGAIAITAAVAALAAITLPVIFILLPTLIGLMAVGGQCATGLSYLLANKPSMFKCIIQGAKTDLILNRFQKSLNEWSLKKIQLVRAQNNQKINLLKEADITSIGLEEIEKLDENKIPKSLRPLFVNLKKDLKGKPTLSPEASAKFLQERGRLLKKYEEREAALIPPQVEKYEKLVVFQNEQIQSIQRRLENARLLDFLKNSGYEGAQLKKIDEQVNGIKGMIKGKGLLQITPALFTLENYKEIPASIQKLILDGYKQLQFDRDKISKMHLTKEQRAIQELGAFNRNIGLKITSDLVRIEALKQDISLLAEAFIDAEFWEDPELKALIEKYGQFTFPESQTAPSSDKIAGHKSTLENNLMKVITRDTGTMMAWLSTQK